MIRARHFPVLVFTAWLLMVPAGAAQTPPHTGHGREVIT